MQVNIRSIYPNSSHNHLLDIIRIFAAILVLLNHFASYSANGVELTMGEDRAYKFLEFFYGVGAVGVEIFFVISGLVIASSASRGSGLSDALKFIYRRGQRIIPTLWMSASVSLMALCSIDFNYIALVSSFIRSIFLFPFGPYIDGVVWSLIVEVFFYFVISAMIFNKSSNRLLVLAISIAFVSIIYNFIFVLYRFQIFGLDDAQILSSLNRFPYKVFLLRYGVFFSLGISIFSLKHCINISKVLFTTICFIFCISEIISSSAIGLENTFIMVCIWMFSVISMVITDTSKVGIFSAWPNQFSEFLKYLGNLSYPLYLNHFTLGIVLTYHLKFLNNPKLRFIVCLFVIFSISAIILHIESCIKYWSFRKSRNV